MKLKPWKELSIGGIVTEPGNSREVETGTWRIARPIVDPAKCTDCLICWVFCPDDSIPSNGKVRFETELYHCKGCGICAVECPYNAIEMVPEADVILEELKLVEKK